MESDEVDSEKDKRGELHYERYLNGWTVGVVVVRWDTVIIQCACYIPIESRLPRVFHGRENDEQSVTVSFDWITCQFFDFTVLTLEHHVISSSSPSQRG